MRRSQLTYQQINDDDDDNDLLHALRDAPPSVLALIEQMENDQASADDVNRQLKEWLQERQRALPVFLHYATMGREATRGVCRSLAIDVAAQDARNKSAIDEATGRDELKRTLTEVAWMWGYRGLVWASLALVIALGFQMGAFFFDPEWVLPSLVDWAGGTILLLWLVVGLYHCFLKWCLRSFERSSRQSDARIERLLSAGDIRLLSVEWLLSSSAPEVLDRRQELPEAAFLSPARAAELWAKNNRLVAVLSYRWLTRLHADPHGLHLQKVRTFLKGARAFEAVFIDFSCVPQKDANGARTAADQAIFERALEAMGAFYSSAKGGTVLQLKTMPSPPPGCEGMYGTDRPYDSSGWCISEESSAQLVVGTEVVTRQRLELLAEPLMLMRAYVVPVVYMLFAMMGSDADASRIGGGTDTMVAQDVLDRMNAMKRPKLFDISVPERPIEAKLCALSVSHCSVRPAYVAFCAATLHTCVCA